MYYSLEHCPMFFIRQYIIRKYRMFTMYYLWMMLQMLDKYSKNVITPNEKCVLMMKRILIEESEKIL